MDFDEFEAQLASVRAQRVRDDMPEELNPFDAITASEAQLAETETTLNVRLPDQYKEFLRRIGGGAFLFLDVLPAEAKEAVFEDLVSVNRGPMRILDFIAVAPVGTGDWWGFPVAGGVCDERVFFWDHETGDLQLESRDFLEFLAKHGLSVNR